MLDKVLAILKNADFYKRSGSYPGKEAEAEATGKKLTDLLSGGVNGIDANQIADVLRADNKKEIKTVDSPMSPVQVGRVLSRTTSPVKVVRVK